MSATVKFDKIIRKSCLHMNGNIKECSMCLYNKDNYCIRKKEIGLIIKYVCIMLIV